MKKKRLTLAMLCCLGAGPAMSQTLPTVNKLHRSQQTVTELNTQDDYNAGQRTLDLALQWTQLDDMQSKAWKMTKDEWLEYKKLMSYGPSAAYYKNKPEVTPLMVLGFNAQSEEERKDYARRSIDMERARITREIAFDDASNRYIQELTRKHPIWMTEKDRRLYLKTKAGALSGTNSSVPSITDTRVVVYADAQRCDSECVNFISQFARNSTSIIRLDLFVLNANSSSELLKFGKRVGITEAKLDEHSATINRDSGSFERLIPSPGLPVAYRVTTAGTIMVKP